MTTIEQLKNDRKLYTKKEAVEILKELGLLSSDTKCLYEELSFDWIGCFETCSGNIKEYHKYEDNEYLSWDETINVEVLKFNNGLGVFSIYGIDSDYSGLDNCIAFNWEVIKDRFHELSDCYKAKSIEDYENELESILDVDNVFIHLTNGIYRVSINWFENLYEFLDIEKITADYIDILKTK